MHHFSQSDVNSIDHDGMASEACEDRALKRRLWELRRIFSRIRAVYRVSAEITSLIKESTRAHDSAQ